jgi:hypothetical protein
MKAEIAGKRIGLLSGTYTLSTSLPGAVGDPEYGYIRIRGGTSSNAHTWVESVTPHGAVFTGGSEAFFYAFLIPETESFVTLKNVKIQNTTGGIRVRGADCVVEGCEITNIYNPVNDNTGALNVGINTDRVTFRNCLIDTFNNSAGSDNACGLGPMFQARNVLVEYCTFKNGPCGIGLKRGCGGITVRNCFFYNVSHPLRTPHLASTAVGYRLPNYYHNNLFVITGTASGGTAAESTMALVTTEFYNNTVVLNGGTSGGDGFWVLYGEGGSSTVNGKFYNNIFYVPSAAAMNGSLLLAYEQSADAAFALMNYNSYGISESKFAMHDYASGAARSTTLAAWRTVLSGKSIAGGEVASFITNPLFMNASGTAPGDFKLQAGSTCKNAGRIGGTSDGLATDMGCWGNGASQIGYSGIDTLVRPRPPVTVTAE